MKIAMLILKEKVIELNERDFSSIDPSNVMAMVTKKNLIEEKIIRLFNMEFLGDNRDIRLMYDLLHAGEVIEVWKGNDIWCKISKDYYDNAINIINRWKGKPQVNVNKDKDKPVLINNGEDLGFILAPRVEQGDE